jgi:hypothetical protein
MYASAQTWMPNTVCMLTLGGGMISEWTREDIDLALTREFWRNGEQRTATLSSTEKRGRIRIGILQERRERLQFYDSGLTYMQAYQLCYGLALELRRFPREPVRAHRIEPIDDYDESEEE